MSEPRKVDDSDYNRLRNTVTKILGVGNSNRGYGQTLNSFDAEQGSLITAQQWNSLSADISNTVIHQTGSFPTLPTYSNTRSITLTDYNQLESLVNLLDTNRFNVGVGRTVVTPVASKSSNQPWAIRATAVLTVTFPTSNDARHFFNSGGKIRFASSRSGGTNSPQNNVWTSMLASVGNLEFTGNSTELMNYFDLTDNYQIWFQRNSSTPYSSNYYRIEMASDVPVNVAGVARILYFKFTWEDLYPGTADRVDGNLNIEVSQVKAVGPLKNNDTFRINEPTYELTNINYVGSPSKSYFLTASKYTANSANDVYTVVLNTFNVPDGEVVPFTITGVNSSDINNESLSGSFTVFNNTATKTFYTTSRDYIAIPRPVSVPVPQPIPVPYVPPAVRPVEPPPKRARSTEYTSGSGFFVVPNNVYSLTVTVVGGGAGGSSGSEADPWVSGGGGGASGGYKKQTISCSPGQRIEYIVGAGGVGAPRTSGGSVRIGQAGGLTKFGTVFTGGGIASIPVYTNHAHTGGQSSPGGTNGLDGEIIRSSTDSGSVKTKGGAGGGIRGFGTGGVGGDPGQIVDFRFNSRELPGSQAITYPAWNETMNQYAVWSPSVSAGSFSSQTVVNFPFTGQYIFYLQADNSGELQLDGSRILSASNNFSATPREISRNVAAGLHTIGISGTNTGSWSGSNPAGIAALIIGTGRTPMINDGNGGNGSGYGAGGGGGFGQSGGSPPQGGGGNGTSGYIKVEWEE